MALTREQKSYADAAAMIVPALAWANYAKKADDLVAAPSDISRQLTATGAKDLALITSAISVGVWFFFLRQK